MRRFGQGQKSLFHRLEFLWRPIILAPCFLCLRLRAILEFRAFPLLQQLKTSADCIQKMDEAI
jgi:hypothetical protein